MSNEIDEKSYQDYVEWRSSYPPGRKRWVFLLVLMGLTTLALTIMDRVS